MYQLDPTVNSKLQIKLYKNVENVTELKRKLISGELQCCIIKPSLVFDPFQVVVAVNKTLTSQKLTTKSVFTEILFNLSISKNITTSLQTFGIDDNDKNLLVVTISKKDQDSVCEDVYEQILGEVLPLAELTEYTNSNFIKKIYKISEKEANAIPLIDSIVSRIATKDVLSY